eukprot:symbB.v1.2.001433.t1/scaffold58.1/size370606/2
MAQAPLTKLSSDGCSGTRATLSTDEIFDEVDKDKSGSVELKEFELVLKIVYDRFGFSRSEVKAFYTLFDRYDADLSGELSADELAGALGWCGHPTSIAEARDIIERYLEKSIQSISRPEFLRIMRCVAEEEIEEFRALFSAMDDDDSGFLDMHELSELFFKLGYTIHSSVIEEAVHGLFPAGVDDGIIFEDCVHVLAYIRSNEGFSKDEAQNLKSVFRKFCSKGRDELREFELTRALSWLGYPLSSQRRRQLWCRVDLDKSGAIHEGEFLKLVRHLREEDGRFLRERPPSHILHILHILREVQVLNLLALAMKRGLGRWAPLALAPALTGAVDVRGVAPSEQARYRSDEFRCFSAADALALPPDVVNDDFCDCADGSDEPGTNACAGQSETLFYCANVKSDAALIYTSRVNDGVCDCCDGSDEWGAEQRGQRSCANTCAQEGLALQRQRAAQISELRSGIKQRTALIGKAKSERLASDKELEQLRQNLPSLETEEQKAREVLEAAEAAVEEEQRLALANETEGNRSADGADTPEPVQEPTSKSDSASAGVDIADRAQKPVVSEYSKWMDGAEKVLEADGEEKPVVSEYSKWMDGAEKVLEPKDSMGSEHQKAADSPDTTEPDVPDAGADGTPGLTRLTTKLRDLWSSFKGWIFGNKTAAEKALDRARELHNAAKKKLKKDRVKMAQLEEKLKSGEDEQELAFSGLTDRCIEKSIGEYKYKICFFKDAKQDSISIGNWKGWSSSSGTPVGTFDGGQYCPGGPERSLTVKFRCGNEELLDVTEPSRCAYEAQLKHPAACTPELLNALENQGETSAAQILLAKLQHANSGPMVPEADMKAMLNKIGYSPAPNILAQALQKPADTSGDGHTDVHGILSILSFLRETQVKKLRQSAGLSDQQVAKIRSKFGMKLEAGKRVEPQEFERFMYDLFKNAKHSLAAQEKIQELIQENFVDGSLGLSEMFWVVRLYDDARAEEAWALEEEIIKDAGFTTAQVAQLREHFVNAEFEGCGCLTDSQVTEIACIVKATRPQRNALEEALEGVEAKDAIDFPNFLRLMGIMAKKGKLAI